MFSFTPLCQNQPTIQQTIVFQYPTYMLVQYWGILHKIVDGCPVPNWLQDMCLCLPFHMNPHFYFSLLIRGPTPVDKDMEKPESKVDLSRRQNQPSQPCQSFLKCTFLVFKLSSV